MNKKIPTIIIVMAIVVSVGIAINTIMPNSTELEKIFMVDAIYFKESGLIEITFEDKTNMTRLATLEILGMPESFQKKFSSSSFVEKIPLSTIPKYGWQSMPITLVLEHEKLGMIGIKTEVRGLDEPKPPVMFSQQ